MIGLRKHLMSDEEYIESNGCKCPFCESRFIVTVRFDAYGREMPDSGRHCTVCGAFWWNIYELSGYDVRQGPERDIDGIL